MRKPMRRPVAVVLLAMVASLLGVISPGTANAAESIPELQWPAVKAGGMPEAYSGPSGSVTINCQDNTSNPDYANNLMTFSATGQVIRDIPRTEVIDGATNCIFDPAIGKDGDLYGLQDYGYGPNLLAYDGNTLKWKYPAACNNGGVSDVAAGADGNVYLTTRLGTGDVRLYGLAPDLGAGQTQPTKVVDINVPNDCSIQLYPYKDGIMVHGYSTGGALFYSYGGQLVAQTPGRSGDERINTNGQLFYPTFTWMSNGRSASVEMYHPGQDNVLWTTPVSTPGADVSGVSLHPLPDGGIVALVNEQKMASDGVPATPEEDVFTIVTINSVGQKVQAVTLPNTGAGGVEYGNHIGQTRVATDTSGKLGLVRTAWTVVTTASGSTEGVPAVAVGVYDPYSGAWTYQALMTGDALKSGGPNGYDLNKGPWFTNGTLLFMAACSGNCEDRIPRLYPVKVTGVGMDYPQGDVLAKTQRPSASYIALGDSFSSGEGVAPFDADTDLDLVNTCHQSQYAYARLIAGSSANIPSLGADGFRACSGAQTKHVTGVSQWNEGVQLDWWPDSTTQLVTMTIGGNDIKFADFAKECVLSTCQAGSSVYNESDNLITELPAKLEATYKRILQYAPNAQIYVIGYPQVIADMEGKPFDIRCAFMYNATGDTGAAHYPWEDAWAARDIVTKLNNAISTAITNVKNLSSDNFARLHYVKMDGPDSEFAGYEMCSSGESYFQNVDEYPENDAAPFHPNAAGQQAYARAVVTAINGAA